MLWGAAATRRSAEPAARPDRELPAWLASMLQGPVPVKLTVDPEIEHTPMVEASTANVIGFPEAPPLALTWYRPP